MHLSRPSAYRAIVVLVGVTSGALAISAAVAAAAFAGPTVTVRVEGEHSTLLPATTVTLGTPDPLNKCAANSAGAAINLATGGNWDHKSFTETILGETHSFAHSDTWAEWVNYKWGGGICNDILNEGDEVLMVADLEPAPTFAATVLPLVLSEAPSVVQAGSPFSVKVSVAHLPAGEVPPGSGTLEPAEGVTVSLGTIHVTTGPGGVASITPAGAGSETLQATKVGDAPSRALPICIHNGNDGNCGTTPVSGAQLTGTPPVVGVKLPQPAPYKGRFALVPHLIGISDGAVYRRGHAPRLIAGSIASHSAVSSVTLTLRRTYRRHCWAYDGVRQRLLRGACGRDVPLVVGHSNTFSYLLPFALPPGRYVLDVGASDAAGNVVALARGTSRTVFVVR